MKKIITLLLVYLFCFASFLFSQDKFLYAAPGENWIVLSDAIPVMRTPQTYPTSEEIILNMVGILGKNTHVKILDTKGILEVWTKVSYTSNDGYMVGWVMTSIVKSAKNLSKTKLKNASANNWGLVRYSHAVANVRASRSTSSKIVSQLALNQKVKVDFLKDNWYAVFKPGEIIRQESNAIGFVHSSLLYPTPKSNLTKAATSKKLIAYKIVKKEDQSYRGESRMTYRVLLNVSEKPKDQKIKDVALSIWKNGNKSWGEFTVFLYLPEMNTNSSAYGIANFTPSGLKDFDVQEYALWGTKWKKK